LHRLTEGRCSTLVAENSLKWAVLEEGEEIVIGPHRLRFESMGKSEVYHRPGERAGVGDVL
jgi:hypothetical protein